MRQVDQTHPPSTEIEFGKIQNWKRAQGGSGHRSVGKSEVRELGKPQKARRRPAFLQYLRDSFLKERQCMKLSTSLQNLL